MSLEAAYTETWLHRVNPAFKLLMLIVLLLFALFVNNLDFMINLTMVSLLPLILFSGHPWRRLLLFASPFLLIFVSGCMTMTLFGVGHTVWFHWGLVRISRESFFRGLHIGLRALDFGMLGLLFALTTRPVLLFYALMQQLRLPPKYAYSFMAGIRLLPIMLDELQTLRYALKVRGTAYGRFDFYRRLRRYAVPLLAQSIRRAQRIAVAMEAKRFSVSGRQRTFYYRTDYSWNDAAFALYFAAVTGAAFWFSHLYPYTGITDVRIL